VTPDEFLKEVRRNPPRPARPWWYSRALIAVMLVLLIAMANPEIATLITLGFLMVTWPVWVFLVVLFMAVKIVKVAWRQ
jgi:hypothetical protein